MVSVLNLLSKEKVKLRNAIFQQEGEVEIKKR